MHRSGDSVVAAVRAVSYSPEIGHLTLGEWSRHSDLDRGPAVYEREVPAPPLALPQSDLVLRHAANRNSHMRSIRVKLYQVSLAS